MDYQTPTAPDILTAPFPWFGGKSRVAEEVWSRFGDVPNYVEPFAWVKLDVWPAGLAPNEQPALWSDDAAVPV